MKKLKYSPGIGKLVYSNGKPYKKSDAIEVAFELGHGYKSTKPLGLINEARGLVLDNIIPVEAPVILPEGLSMADTGEYIVEYASVVYGQYRSLETANMVLMRVISSYNRRMAELGVPPPTLT